MSKKVDKTAHRNHGGLGENGNHFEEVPGAVGGVGTPKDDEHTFRRKKLNPKKEARKCDGCGKLQGDVGKKFRACPVCVELYKDAQLFGCSHQVRWLFRPRVKMIFFYE